MWPCSHEENTHAGLYRRKGLFSGGIVHECKASLKCIKRLLIVMSSNAIIKQPGSSVLQKSNKTVFRK